MLRRGASRAQGHVAIVAGLESRISAWSRAISFRVSGLALNPLPRGFAGAGLVLALLVVASLPGLAAVVSAAPPAEDAAILMRYAQNLATGAGLVWNRGEAPLDGATDLLFTVLVASLCRLGLSVETAARVLGFAGHLGVVFLVFREGAKRLRAPMWVPVVAGLFVAWGPGVRYIEMGFGTTVFALAGIVLFLAALRVVDEGATPGRALWLGLAAVLCAFARPEGAILGAATIGALVVAEPSARSWRFLRLAVGVWVGLGLLFLIGRWSFFGHPLPLPFYKKGGWLLHLQGLRSAIEGAVRFAWPMAILVPLGLGSRSGRREVWLGGAPVAVFLLAWLLLSDEMNILSRFQYVCLPWLTVAALRWSLRWGEEVTELWLHSDSGRGQRLALRWVLAAGCAALLVSSAVQYRVRGYADSRREVGMALAKYAGSGLTLMTTEAGLLPLYSQWRTVDAWGLNDIEIGRHGLTIERIRAEDPAVIVFHGMGTPLSSLPGGGAWNEMVLRLHEYGVGSDYLLAAAWGPSPFAAHWYFVRCGLPETDGIVAAVRVAEYRWWATGQRTFDFSRWEDRVLEGDERPGCASEPRDGVNG